MGKSTMPRRGNRKLVIFHSFLYVYQRVHNFTHSQWATTQLSSKANSLATFHGQLDDITTFFNTLENCILLCKWWRSIDMASQIYNTKQIFLKKNMLVLLFISQNVGTYLYLSCWCFKQLPKKSQKLPSPEGAVLVFQPHESTPNNPELK